VKNGGLSRIRLWQCEEEEEMSLRSMKEVGSMRFGDGFNVELTDLNGEGFQLGYLGDVLPKRGNAQEENALRKINVPCLYVGCLKHIRTPN
jgi:hypothetical protein